jgi:hypothetical protein
MVEMLHLTKFFQLLTGEFFILFGGGVIPFYRQTLSKVLRESLILLIPNEFSEHFSSIAL